MRKQSDINNLITIKEQGKNEGKVCSFVVLELELGDH